MTGDYIRLLRIKHWIKDVFIFAPLIFSQNFYKPIYIGRTLLMCAAFCLAASAVYILNDVADRERDRLHPKKQHRPKRLLQLKNNRWRRHRSQKTFPARLLPSSPLLARSR